MENVDRNHYDPRDPVRSIYHGGLKNVFAACHDPLPSRMQELLERLQDREEESH